MITRSDLKHERSSLITDVAVHCLHCAEQAFLSKAVHQIHKTRLAETHLALGLLLCCFLYIFLFAEVVQFSCIV